MPTFGALVLMSAQLRRSAYFNGTHNAQMSKRQAVGLPILRAVVTKDVSHLDTARPSHQVVMLKLFGYTIEGTADLRQVHLADVQIHGRGRGRPVAKEQLHVVQARPRFNQMRGEAVP